MTNTLPSLLLASAVAVAAASSASAATVDVFDTSISAGESITVVDELETGSTTEFRFFVLEDLAIEQFVIAATGSNGGDDLGEVRYGFTNPGSESFTGTISSGTVAGVTNFFDGGAYSAGSEFSIFFNDGIRENVGLTVTFDTVEISSVPVPAAGFLLGAALLGGGFAARRKRKAA